MSKNLMVTMLMDFYGELLTQKQLTVMRLYYDDDLSLSEIAQQEGITRQGVRDSIKRGELLLFDYENKLGLADKFIKCRQILDNIYNLASNIQSDKITSSDIQHQAEQIKNYISKSRNLF